MAGAAPLLLLAAPAPPGASAGAPPPAAATAARACGEALSDAHSSSAAARCETNSSSLRTPPAAVADVSSRGRFPSSQPHLAAFSSTATCWETPSAAQPAAPTVTRTASVSAACASASVLRDSVAEKSAVWRSGRTAASSDETWRAKPKASMRSASSSTRYVTRRRLAGAPPLPAAPRRRRSTSRPGVATTTSAPARSALACSHLLEPPVTHTLLSPTLRPRRLASAWICCASSRVGASTSPMGPSPASSGRCSAAWRSSGSR